MHCYGDVTSHFTALLASVADVEPPKTLNKFGFICLVKGEIFLDKDRKPFQRDGIIAQLSAQEPQSLQMYPFVLDVRVNSSQRLEDFYAFHLFSQNICKYDLYLWI